MAPLSVFKRWRIARAARRMAAFTLPAILMTGQAAANDPWPHEVQAVYKVRFNGFDVGTFEFNSTVQAQTYTLTGNAQLSALLGALTWKGETRTAGALSANTPKPAGYTFDFNGIGKSGSIKMGFAGDNVASVSHMPPLPPQTDIVPVRDAHLKGVLDPLSAVMALARTATSGGDPCKRKLSIFDGRQRFDLMLTFLREERIVEAKPSGQPDMALVCRVQYVPVAGHKLNEETQHMATTSGIEIALRPVPSANLFVPHQITVPTIAGSATLTSHWVQITTQRNGQIALVY
ncbi:MAG: DUF3108 domain-containing protein [Hyphomicrobiaceae bacterium]